MKCSNKMTKEWNLIISLQVQLQEITAEQALMAEARSPFGVRMLVMDISLALGLLVCGDRMGNMAAFSIPEQSLDGFSKRLNNHTDHCIIGETDQHLSHRCTSQRPCGHMSPRFSELQLDRAVASA